MNTQTNMSTTEVKPSAAKNPKKARNPSLAPKKDLKKKTKKSKAPAFDETVERNDGEEQQPASGSEQLSFFLKQLESAVGVRVSALELDPIKGLSFYCFLLCLYTHWLSKGSY